MSITIQDLTYSQSFVSIFSTLSLWLSMHKLGYLYLTWIPLGYLIHTFFSIVLSPTFKKKSTEWDLPTLSLITLFYLYILVFLWLSVLLLYFLLLSDYFKTLLFQYPSFVLYQPTPSLWASSFKILKVFLFKDQI